MGYVRQKWRTCGEKRLMMGIAMFLLVSMLMTCFRVAGYSQTAMATSDQDAASDYSFYQLSNTAASALSTAMGDTSNPTEKVTTYFGDVPVAAIGGIMGYTSKDNNRGIWGMFMNALSIGANTKEYVSLNSSLINKVGGTGNSIPYAVMGASLAQLGLDKSDSGISFGESLKRVGFGMIAQLTFDLVTVLTSFFGFTIDILRLFNPFQFFAGVTGNGNLTGMTFNAGPWATHMQEFSHLTSDNIGMLPDGTQTQVGRVIKGIATSGVFSSLVNIISKYWDLLFAVGMVITTVILAWILVKFFMPGHMGRLEGLRGWFIRVLFIMGGIVLLGSTYTNCLDWIGASVANGNTAAIKVIASTFFDFEGWAMRGMPLNDVELEIRTSDGSIMVANSNVQTLCFKLNRSVQPALSVMDLTLSDDNAQEIYGSIVSTMQEIATAEGTAGSAVTSDTALEWAHTVLDRYMSGSRIYSSSYESAWKAKNWADSSSSFSSLLADFINQSDDVNSLLSSGDFDDRWTTIKFQYLLPNPFAPGTGNVSESVYSWTAAESGTPINGLAAALKRTTSAGTYTDTTYVLKAENMGDMSAMSVYNYLNTTFRENAFTIYSSETSASEFVRDSHYSVNLVGSGFNSIVIFALSMLMLICYAILAVFYAGAIMLENIKRGIRLLVAIPGAMLGMLQSIAKVVSYTVLMIVEILATMLLYSILSECLYITVTAITESLYAALEQANLLAGVLAVRMSPIIGLLAIVFLVWFTMNAVRLRKPVVKMFEEMADNTVQKFILGTSGGAGAGGQGGRGGAGAAAAGAAGAAAGAAAAGSKKQKKGLLGKIQAKNAEAQADTEMKLSQMFGSGSSAFAEEQNLDNLAKQKKENRAQARREKLEAGKKLVVGAAETAAGAATGNAALMAAGAKNLAEGTSDMSQADTNLSARNAIATASAAQQNGARISSPDTINKAGQTLGSIKKFDAGKEVATVAGAALGASGASAGALMGGEGEALAQGVQQGGGSSVMPRALMGSDGKLHDTVAQGAGGAMYDDTPETARILGGHATTQGNLPTTPGKPSEISGSSTLATENGTVVGTQASYTDANGNTSQFNMWYDKTAGQMAGGHVTPAADSSGQPMMGNWQETMEAQQDIVQKTNSTLRQEPGVRMTTTGFEGNQEPVPVAGDKVVSSDGSGTTLVECKDKSNFVVNTAGGPVNIGIDDKTGAAVAIPSEGMSAEQIEAQKQIVKSVNTLAVNEHNLQEQAAGRTDNMLSVDSDGNIVQVDKNQTVNGRSVVNLQTAEEVRQGGVSSADASKIPVTQQQAQETYNTLTQDQKDIVNSIRSAQAGYQQGAYTGIQVHDPATGNLVSETTLTAEQRATIAMNQQAIQQMGGGEPAYRMAMPESGSGSIETQTQVNGNVRTVVGWNSTSTEGSVQVPGARGSAVSDAGSEVQQATRQLTVMGGTQMNVQDSGVQMSGGGGSRGVTPPVGQQGFDTVSAESQTTVRQGSKVLIQEDTSQYIGGSSGRQPVIPQGQQNHATVQNQTRVDAKSDVQYVEDQTGIADIAKMGGGAVNASFSQQQQIQQQNLVNVNRGTRYQYNDQGASVSGGQGGGVSVPGVTQQGTTINQTTTHTVNHGTQINHQQGAVIDTGHAGGGAVPQAQGAVYQQQVTDTVQRQRNQELLETGGTGLGSGIADGDDGSGGSGKSGRGGKRGKK